MRWLAALVLAVQAAAQTIAVDVVQTRVHMPVAVNGEKPVTFILDTGAGRSPVDAGYAEAIGIETYGQGTAHGAGGAVRVDLARDFTLEYAGNHATLRRVPLTPLDKLSLRVGQPVRGIVGYDVLKNYVTEIDYAGERVTFHPRSFQPPKEAVRLPIRMDGSLPTINARITLPDGRELAARLLVDTGAGFPLVLTRDFAKKHDVDVAGGIDTSIGMGVGGATRERIGRLPKVQLGGFTFDNMVAVVSRDTTGVLSKSNWDGLIGGELLRRFTLYTDYGRKSFALQPNRAFAEPFEFDMTGAMLASLDDTFRTLVVRDVIAGSPAAAAGLRAGDELLAVDGKRVTPADLDDLRVAFRKPGRELTLTIGRDGAESTVTVLTRRLL